MKQKSLKLVSWNVNGIRAVERKGELELFLKKHDPDILFIQETKSQVDQLDPIVKKYADYDQHYHQAEKKGYSGTGIWIKSGLADYEVTRDMPTYDDNEGRVMRIDVGEYTMFGVYFPNGGKSDEAWKEKLVFYKSFLKHLNDLRKKGRKVVWCGDVNVAHEEIDLARPKDNDGKIGFHPKERAWVDEVIKADWIDVFRTKHPKEVIYSWWHLISKARARNVGWRIDYFFVDKPLMKQVHKIAYDNDQMGSDHCPVMIKLKM